MTKKKKGLIAALSAVGAVLLALCIFLLVWFCGASYKEFDAVAKKEAKIPGLKEGISPQGLCPLPENEGGFEFAMSGYMVDKSASRVYLIDNDSETVKYVTLTKGGKPLTTHFGGITCTGNYLVVASGKSLVRISLSDALEKDVVEIADSFETGIQNAFCYYADGVLYAGEFYREKNYKTDPSHHIEGNGETNFAFVFVYEADEAAEGGVKDKTPTKILSVRGLVQGIAVYGDQIALSTSYGLPDSKLYVYENVLKKETNATFSLDGKEIPLYRLDGTNLKSELRMPCMSEEIFVEGDRMYILFESLCNKYKTFVRKRVDCIYSVSLGDL